jgi:hypothetical protein
MTAAAEVALPEGIVTKWPWSGRRVSGVLRVMKSREKHFASRRKVKRTPFTEGGIRDYLLLLSIHQTLRYRNVSFWRILLSGETDIEAFTRSRR